jgi:hypothetical protein
VFPAAYYNGIRYKAGEKSPHGNTGYGIYVDWESKAALSEFFVKN